MVFYFYKIKKTTKTPGNFFLIQIKSNNGKFINPIVFSFVTMVGQPIQIVSLNQTTKKLELNFQVLQNILL